MHSTLESLVCLARDRTPAGRTVLFDRVAGLLLEGADELPAGATALIDQILTGLLHEVEAEVRKKLACRIAMLASAPRDLVRALAADDIEIAEPVLVQSPVLSTRDLLDVLEARSPAHREALARRAHVPEEVMAALVRLREPQVIKSLLSNAGVSIPRNIFNDLVAIAEGMEQIRMPLVAREEMPKDLAYQMFWYVSAAMRQSILKRFPIAPRELDLIMAELVAERGAKRVRSFPPQSAWTTGEVQALVAKVRGGDVEGFTKGLSAVTGVDTVTARRIVRDAGGEPLAVACKAMGADRTQFTSIVVHVDKLVSGVARPPAFLADVARTYDSVTTQAARAMLKVWSLHSAPQAA